MAGISYQSSEPIIKYGTTGAGIGTAIAPGIGTAIGAGIGSLVGAWSGWQQRRQHHKDTVTRNAIGSQGDAALKETARANREAMNSALTDATANINREWASAGRYQSGQRLGAIERTTDKAMGELARVNSANALDLFKFNTQTAEERAWRQAQLDAQTGNSKTELIGDILGMGVQTFMSNPEGAKAGASWLGNKLGISNPFGSEGVSAPDVSSDAMSLFGETEGSTNFFAPEEYEPTIPNLAPSRQTSQGGVNPLSLGTAPAQNQPTASNKVFNYATVNDLANSVESMSEESFINKYLEDSSQSLKDFNDMMINSVGQYSSEEMTYLSSLLTMGYSNPEAMYKFLNFVKKKRGL